MAEDCSLVTDEDVGVILRTALDDVEKIGGDGSKLTIFWLTSFVNHP